MRSIFILLLSCLPCFAQFGVEQPMFQLTSTEPWPQENLLVSFFDVSDGSVTLTLSGSQATNWANRKTTSDPAYMTTLSQAPTWTAGSGPGSKGVGWLAFDGGDYFDFYPTNALYFKSPCTMAVVFKLTTGTKGNEAILGTDAQSMGLMNEFTYGVGGLSLFSGTRTTGAIRAGVDPGTDWYYAVGIFGGNGTASYFWTNGVYVGTLDTSANNTLVPEPFHLGWHFNTFGFKLNGAMARFMLWRGALSSNECQQVGARIKNDFGL